MNDIKDINTFDAAWKLYDAERMANESLRQRLAAAQAYGQQLREAFWVVQNSGNDEWYPFTPEQANKAIYEALALPQDTSALEAVKAEVAAKAGEVMRGRCAEYVMRNLYSNSGDIDAIRAIPDVTLGDIA